MSMFLDYLRSKPIYWELCGLTDAPNGNLLQNTDDETAEAQIEFMRWAFHQCGDVFSIIETGTNKGMFSLLVSEILSSHMIDTFDVWPESAKAAAFLNEHIGGVNFTLGDSRDTLSLHEGTADFAWIDGDHEGDGPLRDLLNCFRLRVPYVAVDDTNEPAVGAAVREVITRGMFEEVPNPFAAHDKRKAVLLHIREARECA